MKRIKSILKPDKSLLRDRRAEASYLGTVVSGLVVMLFVALAVNVFSLLLLKQNLNRLCDELIAEAAASGGVPEDIGTRFEELSAKQGLDPDSVSYSFEGSEFIWESGRVQLGGIIRLTVSCGTSVAGSGVFAIPLSVSASASGISEVYWK